MPMLWLMLVMVVVNRKTRNLSTSTMPTYTHIVSPPLADPHQTNCSRTCRDPPGIFQVDPIAFSSFRLQVFRRGLFPLHFLPGLAVTRAAETPLTPNWQPWQAPPFGAIFQPSQHCTPMFMATSVGNGSAPFMNEHHWISWMARPPHPPPPPQSPQLRSLVWGVPNDGADLGPVGTWGKCLDVCRVCLPFYLSASIQSSTYLSISIYLLMSCYVYLYAYIHISLSICATV